MKDNGVIFDQTEVDQLVQILMEESLNQDDKDSCTLGITYKDLKNMLNRHGEISSIETGCLTLDFGQPFLINIMHINRQSGDISCCQLEWLAGPCSWEQQAQEQEC